MELPIKTPPPENNGDDKSISDGPEREGSEHPTTFDSIDLSGLPILGSKSTPLARKIFWFLFILGGLFYTLYYIVEQVSRINSKRY